MKLTDLPTPLLKAALVKLYTEQGMTYSQIATKFEVSISTVYLWLKKFGIPIRGWSGDRFSRRTSKIHDISPSEWHKLGVAGVARKYNLSYQRAYNFWMRYEEVLEDGRGVHAPVVRSARRRGKDNN